MSLAPLISVIIPCHNYGKYVGEAITSVINQTYEHWQIIVIDDGSVDDTRTVVERYCFADPRINYYYQEKQGVSVARNKGLALARGEYIQFLDADDLLAKLKFEKQLSLFSVKEDAALIYGDSYSFDNAAEIQSREFTKFILKKPPVSGGGSTMAMHMAYDNIFLISSPLFRRTIFTELGGFNEAIVAFEDWEFWYRMVLNGYDFVYDNTVGTEFFVRSHGNNTTLNRYKMWKSKLVARDTIMGYLRNMQNERKGIHLNLEDILAEHQTLRNEESARFNMLYGNIFSGLVDTARYSLNGDKPFRIWYDSAYWFKERLLGKLRK